MSQHQQPQQPVEIGVVDLWYVLLLLPVLCLASACSNAFNVAVLAKMSARNAKYACVQWKCAAQLAFALFNLFSFVSCVMTMLDNDNDDSPSPSPSPSPSSSVVGIVAMWLSVCMRLPLVNCVQLFATLLDVRLIGERLLLRLNKTTTGKVTRRRRDCLVIGIACAASLVVFVSASLDQQHQQQQHQQLVNGWILTALFIVICVLTLVSTVCNGQQQQQQDEDEVSRRRFPLVVGKVAKLSRERMQRRPAPRGRQQQRQRRATPRVNSFDRAICALALVASACQVLDFGVYATLLLPPATETLTTDMMMMTTGQLVALSARMALIGSQAASTLLFYRFNFNFRLASRRLIIALVSSSSTHSANAKFRSVVTTTQQSTV